MPVTVTVKVPALLAALVQLSVLVPDPPITEVGDSVQVSPVAGETAAVSVTVPVNPLIGLTVMVLFAV